MSADPRRERERAKLGGEGTDELLGSMKRLRKRVEYGRKERDT